MLIGLTLLGCSSGSTDSTPTFFEVTVTLSPSEGGTISPSADSSYEAGKKINLQANTNDGYSFSNWSGDIDSTENPLSITVDKNYNLIANFQKKSYELKVTTTGEGSVTERIVEQKQKDYEHGTVVELTATPAEDWIFVEWQGDLTGTNNPSQITIDSPKNVTAVFEKKKFTLTVNTSGSGNVTKNPDQNEYEFGTIVDLSASPDNGWSFDKWDGDTTSTSNPISIKIDSAITVTAVFSNDTFAGGNGTESYPYKISNPEQLQAMKDYKDAHFVVVNNIDATETQEWFSGKGFEPIGVVTDQFSGVLDGNGYSISNLFIDRPSSDYIGIFAYAGDEALVSDLSLVNVDIKGKDYVGSLIGFSSNGGNIIKDCSVTGSIIGEREVGGLIGRGVAQIHNTSTNVNIESISRAGGLMGHSGAALIKNSHSKGVVSGQNLLGGLIGVIRSSGGEISNSYSESDVIASNSIAGGLVARNFGLISNSYATGNVEGTDIIGGLVGENISDGVVQDSYSIGSVTGKDVSINLEEGNFIGGLIGINEANVENSRASGNVNSVANEIGGLVGKNTGVILNSLADGAVTTSGDMTGGLVGNNTGQIETSYSSGDVTSADDSGGLVGYSSGSISNSYSLGNVNGETNVGGLVGRVASSGEINYTYEVGLVEGVTNVGGLVGTNEGVSNILSSYWNIDKSDQSEGVGFGNESGVNGLTDPEMIGSSAETNMSGFDFVNIWMTTNSYPALFWE